MPKTVKRPAEDFNYGLSFEDVMGGDSIQSVIAVTALNLMTRIDSTSQIVGNSSPIGSPAFIVGVQLKNIVIGERHSVTVKILTDSNETLQGEILLDGVEAIYDA